MKTLVISVLIYATLAILVVLQTIKPEHAAWIGSIWTFACFYLSARLKTTESNQPIYKEDRFWAGGLASCAVFMLFFFFNFKNKEFAPLNPLADKSIFQIVSGGTSLPLVNYER